MFTISPLVNPQCLSILLVSVTNGTNESAHFRNHHDEHTHHTSSQKETNVYLFFHVPLVFISLVINLSRSAARSHLRLLITAHSR